MEGFFIAPCRYTNRARITIERRLTSGRLSLVRRESLTTPGKGRLAPVWKPRVAQITLVASDALLGILVWQSASLIQEIWGRGELSVLAIVSVVPSVVVWLSVRAFMGLYPGCGLDAVECLRRHVYSVFLALAVLSISVTGFQVGDALSRLLMTLVFCGLLIAGPFVRSLMQRVLKEIGLWGKPVVVLSYKDSGQGVVERLRENWHLGYDPVAVFEFQLDSDADRVDDDRDEAFAAVARDADERGVNTTIFAMPYTRREQLARLVKLASVHFKHVMIIPNLNGVTNSAVVARNLAGTFAVEIKYNLLDPWALRTKRVLDLCLTAVGGILVLPLLVVLASLVYLESGGSIFYRDLRMGRDGKLFPCIKFRTMVPDAEELLRRLLEDDAELRKEYYRYHKLRKDPRVTRIGRFLRKTSLDELPQLWNVLKGQMSLVGPRPYLPRESADIGASQGEILRVPPGITGPWQVAGRSQTAFEDRVQMDVYYVRDWSVWLDLVILARTLGTVLLRRGAS